jgi:putative modified peptide
MHAPLDHDTAHKLLDKLANDSDFREHLLGDPVGAMAKLGVSVDHTTVPHQRALPSKAEVKANLEALHTKLTSKAGMIFFLA